VTLTARLIVPGLAAIALVGTAVLVLGPLRAQSPAAPVSLNHRQPPRYRPARHRQQTGFPSASDTGVPAGTALRRVPGQISHGPGWRFDPLGFVEVYGNDAVLNDLYIPYDINITGSGVTIDDVHVINGGRNAIGISLRHTRDVTIENSTISGVDTGAERMMTGIKDIFGDSTGLQVMYNNISEFETGIQIESGLIQGNYIHKPGFIAGDHTNGITSNGGRPGLLTIYHNTILNDRTQTDAIGLFEDFGVQRNRRIVDNLLAGGGYAIYAGQKPGGPATSNIVITGNQISTRYYAKGGVYGCGVNFDAAGRRNIWSDNVWNVAGSPQSPAIATSN
jgi:hypothetical protein